MKKYRIDLFCVVLFFVSIPLLVVDKPEINYNNEIIKVELSETEEQGEITESIAYNKPVYKNLETRNIFSPDGSYRSTDGKELLSAGPYRFIGVFESGQKKAVFMKDTGDVIILNEGDKIEGGFSISSIKNMSVKLEKDDKVIEYRIFKLEGE